MELHYQKDLHKNRLIAAADTTFRFEFEYAPCIPHIIF
jgi:hypothetical protein